MGQVSPDSGSPTQLWLATATTSAPGTRRSSWAWTAAGSSVSILDASGPNPTAIVSPSSVYSTWKKFRGQSEAPSATKGGCSPRILNQTLAPLATWPTVQPSTFAVGSGGSKATF